MKKPNNFKTLQKQSLEHVQPFGMPKQAQKRFYHHSYGHQYRFFRIFDTFLTKRSRFDGLQKFWPKIWKISKLLRNTFLSTYKRLEYLNMLRIVFDVILTAHQHRFFQHFHLQKMTPKNVWVLLRSERWCKKIRQSKWVGWQRFLGCVNAFPRRKHSRTCL